jgi:GTPase
LQLPLFIVFTKIDLTPKEVFEENMAKMNRIMKTHCQRVPVIMKTE